MMEQDARRFPFRPWVRRAGLSIVLVALLAALALAAVRQRETAMWVYVITLLIGGLKVFSGTFAAAAAVDSERLVLRPLHLIGARSISWTAVRGTEQMIGGDRLILYYDTPRGMRFVALNLNLVKGRRDFLALLDERLRGRGFTERIVDRSRYLSRSVSG
jgi:hypothetical protein